MMRKTIQDCLYILLGSLIYSIGINYFTIPNLLSEGGIIGLTIIFHYVFHWSLGIVNFVLNTVLVLVGMKFLEKRAIIYTLFSIFSCSLFLFITEETGKQLTNDTLLAAIFAGLLVGGGIGIIFRAGGTSGGTTILARLANQFLGWSMGKGILAIDLIVVAGSVFIIGLGKAMYTLIAVYLGAKAIDFIVEGLEEKVAVLIISNSSELVLDAITSKLSRGITVLEGRGGYTGDNKDVLYIVINRQEIVQLKNLIYAVDEHAYVTIHLVQEMIGKGYKVGKTKVAKGI
ncbi:YitT family protein [Neobacillus drentensis]|uniref:YitT family protein n=1 Tax=Neobacillus drentensis TaxID=220684 RepID=UPI001F171CFF|nr:YitT family protein [Neobacillus drentensis]ULT56890.1 YitT family protein [Neobacillus drentensis]